MINVLALYADLTGCGDYRVRFPAEAVNNLAGSGVHVQTAGHLDADASQSTSKITVRRIDLPAGVSVVSFQRPTKATLVGAMQWLRDKRPDVAIVVELDDDLANLPANHEAFGSLNPRVSPSENTSWLRVALGLADVVTVSTPELAKRYGGSRAVYVVRNGVPRSLLTQGPSRALEEGNKHGERFIGWAGYTGTHPGDLEITSGALGDVMERRPAGRTIRFRNVGPADGLAKALDLPEELHGRVEASGWLEPDLYRVGLSQLDIGIVPLQDTAFNRAKSALKALEMAAAGVPVVASNLPEFRLLRDAGMPIWLVKPSRKEWATALTSLAKLTDEELKSTANQHRQWVAGHGTVEVRAQDWTQVWRYAASVAARRGRRAS